MADDDISAIVQSSEAHLVCSLDLIKQAIHTYGVEGLAFSFNGGKDCTVLLHLIRAALIQLDLPVAKLGGIRAVYFHKADPFAEMERFMDECSERYGVEIMSLEGDFKSGLEKLLAEHPTKAILMGQRRIDPGARNISVCSPSDPGWPSFMRLNPILEWGYGDVWRFLTGFRMPYCALYDQGFTSMGARTLSLKNPFLFVQDEDRYLPAHRLQDGDMERFGRPKICNRKLTLAAEHPGRVIRVAIIVVDDEILAGTKRDTITVSLCRQCTSRGFQVDQITVIRSDPGQERHVLEHCSQKCDLVYICGPDWSQETPSKPTTPTPPSTRHRAKHDHDHDDQKPAPTLQPVSISSQTQALRKS